MSDNELEDILSCDDDVLNDVYQYWEPSLRRLPPMLLVRLKADLKQYLGKLCGYDMNKSECLLLSTIFLLMLANGSYKFLLVVVNLAQS